MRRSDGLSCSDIGVFMLFPCTGQPWLLRPRISRFVTSPSSGYASRPNRAIDGRKTFTFHDSRLCWPLLGSNPALLRASGRWRRFGADSALPGIALRIYCACARTIAMPVTPLPVRSLRTFFGILLLTEQKVARYCCDGRSSRIAVAS